MHAIANSLVLCLHLFAVWVSIFGVQGSQVTSGLDSYMTVEGLSGLILERAWLMWTGSRGNLTPTTAPRLVAPESGSGMHFHARVLPSKLSVKYKCKAAIGHYQQVALIANCYYSQYFVTCSGSPQLAVQFVVKLGNMGSRLITQLTDPNYMMPTKVMWRDCFFLVSLL